MGTSRGLTIAAIALATACGAWLRLRTLGAEDIWVDEALTLAVSTGSYAELWLAPSDPTPPLYYSLHKLFVGAARDEFAMRSLACVFGILSIPAFGWLGWRMGGAAAGAASALFLAVSATMIEYSQEARAYSLFLFSIILSSVALHSVATHRKHSWTVLPVSLALTIYSHFLGFLWATGTR